MKTLLFCAVLLLVATAASAETKYYANPAGGYVGAYDGPIPAGMTEVPAPPDHALYQTWNGSAWVDVVGRTNLESEAFLAGTIDTNRMLRVLFELNFDQESRLRVLESKPTITKAQYRDAIKTVLQGLP